MPAAFDKPPLVVTPPVARFPPLPSAPPVVAVPPVDKLPPVDDPAAAPPVLNVPQSQRDQFPDASHICPPAQAPDPVQARVSPGVQYVLLLLAPPLLVPPEFIAAEVPPLARITG